MTRSATEPPRTDPTPIFEAFRGNHATELLTAAVAHFGVFARLAEGPVAAEELRESLGLAERPFVVLTTALKALGLIEDEGPDREPCGSTTCRGNTWCRGPSSTSAAMSAWRRRAPACWRWSSA